MPASIELAALYDQHAQALFSLLLGMLRNESDARDVLQELFLKLARASALMDRVQEPRAFLLKLAHNAAIDHLRRRGTRENASQRLAAETESLFAPGSHPDEAAFRDALSRAIHELPQDQRVVLHLKLWEQLTFEAIAELLGISPNTAASRYRYGIDKLRERLRPLYDEVK